MSQTIAKLWWGGLAGAVLTLGGCGNTDPLGAGSMSFGWQVSPRGCGESGVETVEAHIMGPEGLIERFDCAVGAAEIGGLEPGTYVVQLTGLDGHHDPTFETPERTVFVDADRNEDLGTLRLTARPAEIHLTWLFANGRVCGANDVDRVVLAAFDTFDYEVSRQYFDCNDGEGMLDGLPAGAYVVEATAYDGTTATHRGTLTIKASRGATEDSEIVLEPI